MALEDLIARSGGEQFETMRKGWLPTLEERQNREINQINIDSAKSAQAYEPTKRKMSEKKAELDTRYKESLIKKHEFDMETAGNDENRKQYAVNQAKMGRHLKAANKLGSVSEKKRYLEKYRQEILDAGDNEQDQAFNSVLKMDDDQFNENFGLVYQGNQYIQDLNEKNFGKSTSLQNYKTGAVKTVKYSDPNYDKKVDGAISKDFTVIKTPGLEIEGTPKSVGLGGKTELRDLNKQQSGIETANFIGKRTIELLNSSPEGLSVTGSFSRIASSLRAQAESSAKLLGTEWEKGTSFEPGSYKQIFQDAGIDNVKLRGNLTQLARMLATASGEGKVLSDADMKRWLNVVAVGNGDPKIVSSAIRNALEIQNFHFKQQYKLVNGQQFSGDLGFPEEQNKQSSNNEIQSLKDELANINQQMGITE